MRRLSEEVDSSDRAVARAAALLAAMPPLDTERFDQRVPPPLVAPHRTTHRLRGPLVAIVTTASAAAAANTLHTHWSRAHADATPASQTGAPDDSHGRKGKSAKQLGRSEAESQDIVAQSDQAQTYEDRPAATPTMTPPSANRRPAHSARVMGHAAGPTSDEDESALIVAAVRALRRDGDAPRAEQLAEQALQRYPHGRQVEEAMDLAMEAAFARGDANDARRAAQRYLASFRAGRFADRALQILAASER
jgi:hypothetical protein